MKKMKGALKTMAEVWKLVAPYWRSEEKYKAWSMLLLIVALNLGFVYAMVVLNKWNVVFYDALQKLDKATFITQCYKFLGVVTILVSLYVSNAYLTGLLGFQWRKWLTKQYLNRWMDQAMYYRLSLQGNKTDNPDQRISQDLANFATQVLTLGLSFFKEAVSLSTFMMILWSISGAIQIPLPNQGSLTIPGYMVWLALTYAIVGTWIVYKIGKPLIKLDFNQEKLEANFRYQLVRLRERSEEVAFYKGEKSENYTFRQAFNGVYENFQRIINRGLYVNGWQNFYNNFSTIFPILIAAPQFFSGAMTLGVLMQINSAFMRVQDSLALIVLQFQAIASLIATTNRLLGFSAAMQDLEEQKIHPTTPTLQMVSHPEETLVLENLTLKTPDNQTLFENLNLLVKKGETVLMMGRSGLGKTTLIRAIAGLWSFGEGIIKLPPNQDLFIVPQRAYMPLGTLRKGLFYPGTEFHFAEEKLIEILTACRLQHLIPELDEHRDWSLQLSMGEQQRIIFARAIIQEPQWLIMDEPSASMDKETEKQVYNALHQYLPNATVITIGHSPSLKAFHSRILELDPLENLAELKEAREIA